MFNLVDDISARFSRFDFDAPKERLALVTWKRRREVGLWKDTYHEFRWEIVEMRSSSHLADLERIGLLYFGRPPWRKSQIVAVIGGSGSIEAAVALLPAPLADFEFFVKFDAGDPLFHKSADVIREEAELRADRPSRKRKQMKLI